MTDQHPELLGYEPGEGKPLRSPVLLIVMRVIVVLGLVGLVLPGLLVTANTAQRTAENTCANYVQYYVPEALSSSARFELFSPGGIGWSCYATRYGETSELYVRSLGLIPGGAALPSGSLENS